jgi:site-specific DNA-methyltransferase (adenine-specific)
MCDARGAVRQCDCRDGLGELAEGSVDLVVTSPPYWNLKRYSQWPDYADYVSEMNEAWSLCVRALKPGGKLCINVGAIPVSKSVLGFRHMLDPLSDFSMFLRGDGRAYIFSQIVWEKVSSPRVTAFGTYPYPPGVLVSQNFEHIWVWRKRGKMPPADRELRERGRMTKEEWAAWCANSVWRIPASSVWRDCPKEMHGAQFPAEVPRRLIRMYSHVGDTVLDPFAGLSTTAVAAARCGRRFLMLEKNPEYVEASLRRLAAEPGGAPDRPAEPMSG